MALTKDPENHPRQFDLPVHAESTTCQYSGSSRWSPSRRDATPHTHSQALTFINSSTEALSFASLTKHLLTKSTNELDHSEEEREGMASKQTAFVTLAEEKPSYGFFPCANSISEMPSDQMSLFNSVSSSNTSGALYHRVPHWLFSLEQECSIRSAKPKSPSLIKPFAEMSRLSGLMSYPFIPTHSALHDE